MTRIAPSSDDDPNPARFPFCRHAGRNLGRDRRICRLDGGRRSVGIDTCRACPFANSSHALPASSPPEASRPILPCAVAIISHNYGRYLQDAIDSVRRQTAAVAELIVVDDSSDDDTREIADSNNIACLRIEAGNLHEAWKAAYAATTARYLQFLDADNRLSPDYLRWAVEEMERRPEVGIVWGELEQFGDAIGRRRLNAANIHRQNFIDSGAVVRRAAWEQSGALRRTMPANIVTADWQAFQEILRCGWHIARNEGGALHYRVHAAQMSSVWKCWDYYHDAQLGTKTVTVVAPLSGRAESAGNFIEWFRAQSWPRRQTRLMLVDTTQAGGLAREIAENLPSDYADVRTARIVVGRAGLAEENRRIEETGRQVNMAVSELYARLRMRIDADCEYVLIIEDDIVPPADAIELLLRGMDANTALVSGVAWSPYEPRYLPWREGYVDVRSLGTGIEDVAGTGFYCSLIRRSVWRAGPMTYDGRSPRWQSCYDVTFCDWLRRHGWKIRVNWSVHCRHGPIRPTDAWIGWRPGR